MGSPMTKLARFLGIRRTSPNLASGIGIELQTYDVVACLDLAKRKLEGKKATNLSRKVCSYRVQNYYTSNHCACVNKPHPQCQVDGQLVDTFKIIVVVLVVGTKYSYSYYEHAV